MKDAHRTDAHSQVMHEDGTCTCAYNGASRHVLAPSPELAKAAAPPHRRPPASPPTNPPGPELPQRVEIEPQTLWLATRLLVSEGLSQNTAQQTRKSVSRVAAIYHSRFDTVLQTVRVPLAVLPGWQYPHLNPCRNLCTSCCHFACSRRSRSPTRANAETSRPAMVQYVFTPWRDRHELLLVRDQLYGDSKANSQDAAEDTIATTTTSTAAAAKRRALQHQAVARISMWVQRGNCPHMVESTALLMAAVLSDEAAAMHTRSSGSETYAVRAAYSAAFSR